MPIKDSGERTEFSTGAVRDMKDGKGRFDLLPWYGIMEVSKHCEEGAKKYGEHNVDRGIPLHSLMDSASRHLAKFMAGETDEDHLRAAAWNILWALNQRTTHPELNDLYFEKDRPRFEMKEDEYVYSDGVTNIRKCDEIPKDGIEKHILAYVDVLIPNASDGKHLFIGCYRVSTDGEGKVKLYSTDRKCAFGYISLEAVYELGMHIYRHEED